MCIRDSLLRYEDDFTVKTDDVKAVVEWLKSRSSSHEINYRPARVLMQDFTGVPAVVDLAAMRDAVVKMGGDAQKVNLSLIHISEPTRLLSISYAVFCLKKKPHI
eukprot:TRINITY_DN64184_c0_g1_i1.p1 TRINITY_DN64184_c0_g1~~TRINITY_DN64184_c0_g1_i1.p1  ORF type:complete len:105 (-),score=31.42 TRINITY_DN64184_c0_g1_i1:122-436(-)